jgi:hypothetical protein
LPKPGWTSPAQRQRSARRSTSPASRTSAHLRGTVTADRGLTGISLGAASYIDMGGTVNEDFRVPMLFVDAVRDKGGQPAWISVAWRDRHPAHDPRRALEMLTEPGHRETLSLTPDPAGHRQAWRDFRAYCAALDHGSNLTSHGTADGDNAIGYSSGSNAAVLTDAGAILASTAASPALAKLRDSIAGWDSAGRPGPASLIATAETGDEGATVRLALPAC